MADNELGKLSPEQIQKLASTISEAKNLTGQQEEIIDRVLAGEIEIGNTRIAALERYFDVYSRNLDKVASKYSSLNETFLVLDKKLSDNFKTLSSDIAASTRAYKKSYEKNADEKPKKETSKTTKDSAEAANKNPNNEIVAALEDLINALKKSSGQSAFATSNTENIGGNQSNSQTSTTSSASPVQVKTADAEPAEDFVSGEVSNQLKEAIAAENRLEALRQATRERIKKADEELRKKELTAEAEKLRTEKDNSLDATEFRLIQLNKVLEAEAEARSALNKLSTENAFGSTDAGAAELADLKARQETAKIELAAAEDLAKKKADYIAKEELKAKRKYEGEELKRRLTEIQKEAATEFAVGSENHKKLTKLRQTALEKEQKDKEKAEAKARAARGDELMGELLGKGHSIQERIDAFKDLTTNDDGSTSLKAVGAIVANAISDLAKQLDSKIDEIGKHQGFIDTRLQGSSNETNYAGSYWGQLTKDMMSVGAVTPFFRQEDFANNIKSLVDRGIAFDLKQRAFLMTIQEKIANTFEVADGTLLRLIRLQQEDSTAGRLGMESALNTFLNEMYENTEYLKDVASSVRGSLQEMESLVSGTEATEIEYQVQKWMGSLYSVGMSQEAVQNIANAFGQIAAGQIDALTNNNGTGNLLVMAANSAGIPIADILAKGLDAEETNKLLQATVNYLADIAKSTKDNRVVQQQLAGVFGVKASDLKAATNLTSAKDGQKSSINDIFNEYLTYDNMLKQLNDMASTMYKRTSIGEMMSNVWDNGQYTLASSMANNPVAYLMYKMAGLLESTTGGISIPAVSIMGNMVDLETTVADLMRVASIGTGVIGSLGDMISGLSSSFSGQAMLTTMGIESGSGLKITPRGGDGVSASDNTGSNGSNNQTTSGSGYVGNASGSDIKNATIQGAEDNKKQLMIEAKEEAEANQIDFINTNVLKIYELLDEVTSGKRNFTVKVSGYGLTSLSGTTSLSSAQGGVSGLLSNNAANTNGSNSLSGGFSSSSGSGSGSTSGSSSNGSATGNSTFGLGSGIDLGGWTIT